MQRGGGGGGGGRSGHRVTAGSGPHLVVHLQGGAIGRQLQPAGAHLGGVERAGWAVSAASAARGWPNSSPYPSAPSCAPRTWIGGAAELQGSVWSTRSFAKARGPLLRLTERCLPSSAPACCMEHCRRNRRMYPFAPMPRRSGDACYFTLLVTNKKGTQADLGHKKNENNNRARGLTAHNNGHVKATGGRGGRCDAGRRHGCMNC